MNDNTGIGSSNPISRRDFLKVSGTGAGALLLASEVTGSPAPSRTPPPNILYIHSHDTGRFTSPYGHSVPTPNIQKLASEGVLFRQAFCAAPTCSPSRACLLTGESAHNNGMLGLVNRGFTMTPTGYSHHIIRTLRQQAGYYSALIGLQHIAPDSHTIGYDSVETFHGSHVEDVAPAAVKFLNSAPKQPFWLTVGFFETHRPYRKATAEDDARYIEPPPPIPDAPATRGDMADFHASVNKLDWGVGEVLKALEAAGLADNTLVISTTDHGISFPTMKCKLFDGGMGVHLVMRGPGEFSGGKVCDAMISQLDIFPTLCEVVNIPPPAWLQGRSFLPVLRGQVPEINDAIFAEINYHGSYEPTRAVRTQRWKYIRYFGEDPHSVMQNVDGGPSKTYWSNNGGAQQTLARESLYDLIFDPQERNNLAADPAHSSTFKEMQDRLDKWMHDTNDPLLAGPVPAPPGAKVNVPTDIHPAKAPAED